MTALFALEPASLLALALLIWLVSGVAGWVFSAAARLSSLLCGLGGMLASAAAIVAAF